MVKLGFEYEYSCANCGKKLSNTEDDIKKMSETERDICPKCGERSNVVVKHLVHNKFKQAKGD